MKTRTLGQSNLKSPSIMFGGNVFGWTLDKQASFRMLDMLLERGFTFIDTADVYGSELGRSEQLIGQWMKDRGVRDKITIATKAGRTYKKMADGSIKRGVNNSRPYISKAAEESLKRLQTDHIELFYTHYDDQITPAAELLEAHHRLIHAGKVQVIGASNYSDTRLKTALTTSKGSGLPQYEVFQTEYNLMERKTFETKLRQLCKDYNVSVAAYFSLASGFLTGKYRKKEQVKNTARQKYTERYITPKGLKVLGVLDDIAEAHGVSQAGVALAWILNRPGIDACLVSATKEHHLDAFQEGLELHLSDPEMARLNTVSDY